MLGNVWGWLLFVYALSFFFCKLTELGGLGAVSVGQVEPQQVCPEIRLGLFPFCWGLLAPTVGVGACS